MSANKLLVDPVTGEMDLNFNQYPISQDIWVGSYPDIEPKKTLFNKIIGFIKRMFFNNEPNIVISNVKNSKIIITNKR